jgi:hypothetical protein
MDKKTKDALYKKAKNILHKHYKVCQVCGRSSILDYHHRAKRVGVYMYAPELGVLVCRMCHMHIESEVKQSRERGLILYPSFDIEARIKETYRLPDARLTHLDSLTKEEFERERDALLISE